MGDASRRNPLICTRPRFSGAGKEGDVLILSQNGQSLANLDNLSGISYHIGNEAIYGFSFYGSNGLVLLGKYDKSRTTDILREIMNAYDDRRTVYEMPKE